MRTSKTAFLKNKKEITRGIANGRAFWFSLSLSLSLSLYIYIMFVKEIFAIVFDKKNDAHVESEFWIIKQGVFSWSIRECVMRVSTRA